MKSKFNIKSGKGTVFNVFLDSTKLRDYPRYPIDSYEFVIMDFGHKTPIDPRIGVLNEEEIKLLDELNKDDG